MQLYKQTTQRFYMSREEILNGSTSKCLEEGELIIALLDRLEKQYIKQINMWEDIIKSYKKKKKPSDRENKLYKTWWIPNIREFKNCLKRVQMIKKVCYNSNKHLSKQMKTRGAYKEQYTEDVFK